MTALEILDSSVKIGLGALISSVTTFLVTKRNNAHELEKLVCEDKKSLVREVSTLLEEGTSNLNRCIHEFWKEQQGCVDLSLLIESSNAINKAKALAIISDNEGLFDEISKYSAAIQELYVFLNEYGEGFDEEKANEFVRTMNDHWGNIHPLLSNAYKSIWSDA